MFAISVDSLTEHTNVKIGRTVKGKTLNATALTDRFLKIKSINPSVKIKINTVVNKHNFKENMREFIASVKPYKWKVFQALSVGTQEEFCSVEEYITFLENHKYSLVKMTKENNEDMRESYIMIDPYGRFYQNGGSAYEYNESLLVTTAENAFNSIGFDHANYDAPYA